MNVSTLCIGLAIYLLLLAAGLGFSLALTRHRYDSLTISLGLGPVIGSCLVIVIGTWLLQFDIAIEGLLNVMIGVTIISLIFSQVLLRKDPSILIRIKQSRLSIAAFALIAAFIGCFWNNYRHHFFYHFLGPDIPSYAMSSQWLLNGNTTKHISFSYVEEILVNAHRMGTPIITALLTKIIATAHTNVPMIIQLFTFIFFACSAWVMTWIMSENRRKSFANPQINNLLSALIAACVLGNAGLLFYLNEGFYPQIIATSLLNIILCMFLAGEKNYSIFILGVLLSAAILPTYNECFIMLCLFISGSCALNLVTRDISGLKNNFFYLTIIVCALLLCFPISKVFLTFSINNSLNVTQLGYAQPGWMLPSDVMGISNIFSSMKKYLDNELAVATIPFKLNFFKTILSIWVIAELLHLGLRREKILSKTIIILGIAWVGIYAANIYLLYYHDYKPYNYLYNKVIIDLAPLLTLVFISAILTSQKTSSKNINYLATFKLVLVMSLTLLSFATLARDRSTLHDYVDLKSIEIIANSHVLDNYEIVFNERGYRKGHIIGQLRYIDRTSDSIIGALLQKQIIDQWWNHDIWDSPNTKKYFSMHREIALIIRKKDLLSEEEYSEKNKMNILINTPSYLVVKTNTNLSQVLKGDIFKNYSKFFAR